MTKTERSEAEAANQAHELQRALGLVEVALQRTDSDARGERLLLLLRVVADQPDTPQEIAARWIEDAHRDIR